MQCYILPPIKLSQFTIEDLTKNTTLHYSNRTRRAGVPSLILNPSWSSDWSSCRWCCHSLGPCSTGCMRWRWRRGPARSSARARCWRPRRTQSCICRPGCKDSQGCSVKESIQTALLIICRRKSYNSAIIIIIILAVSKRANQKGSLSYLKLDFK